MKDEDSGPSFVTVVPQHSQTTDAFLQLGTMYLEELNFPPHIDRDRFLQSILKRVGDPDRWLELLKVGDEFCGFFHAKIDRDERPGWGYVLEFGVVSGKRHSGLGRLMFNHLGDILKGKGVADIWLTSDSGAEVFWKKMGFVETGLFENGQKILVAQMSTTQGAEQAGAGDACQRA